MSLLCFQSGISTVFSIVIMSLHVVTRIFSIINAVVSYHISKILTILSSFIPYPSSCTVTSNSLTILTFLMAIHTKGVVIY